MSGGGGGVPPSQFMMGVAGGGGGGGTYPSGGGGGTFPEGGGGNSRIGFIGGSSTGGAGISTALPPPFLTKLYELVEDEKTDDLVGWSADGRSFTVHKTTQFARDVLPRYFKHNNFSSFVRQLNQYGFHKQDPDNWTFGHENFRKGRKDLLVDITRRKSKVQIQSTMGAENLLSNQKLMIELDKYGIVGEVETLRRHKDVLMKELMNARKEESKLKRKCDVHESRIKQLETNMKKMQEFLFYYFSPILQNYGNAKSKRKRLPPTTTTTEPILDYKVDDVPEWPNLDRSGDSDADSIQRKRNQILGGSNSNTPLLTDANPSADYNDVVEALFPFQMANSQPNNAYPPASVQELSLGDGKTPSEVQVGGVNKKRRVQTDNGRASKPLAVSNAPTQTTAKSNAKSSSDLQNGEWNTGRATPTPAMPAPPIIESPLPNQDIWTDSASQLTPTLEAALQAASTPNLENAQSFDASAEASPLFGHNADQSVLNTPTVGGSTPTAGAGQTPVVGQTLFNPADNGFETVFYNDPDSDLAENENKDQNGTDDAMDDFLDMDLGSQCFPPLASLPQGTDIEAFAQCMEDFQDSAY